MLLLKKNQKLWSTSTRQGGPMEDLLSVNIGTISYSFGSIPNTQKKTKKT